MRTESAAMTFLLMLVLLTAVLFAVAAVLVVLTWGR